MAALISKTTGIDSVLIEGGRGEFTVWVGDEQVARKDANGFPTDQNVVTAVQIALGKR